MSARAAPSRPITTATETATATAILADVAATHRLGARLARALRPGDLVGLEGELGAGKSELARAVIRARAGARIEVPSPTFTLVQTYALAGLLLTHADLYRVMDPAELAELGLDEALAEGALLVEWPERGAALLPADRLTIRLEPGQGPGARRASLIAGPSWAGRLAQLLG